ncbi:inositol monophosphatase [Streptomyces sp. RPA4-2]|uniref:inositol monophosphatase family protein n=1 Tax=Streptomyces sp. RPA4-2 TaxID=2721244 RepID=UPI00143EBBF6|nr:inositol monophosphatase family protein [Streptomyces sp. RPA4-2]QIY66451.1 inositol monophosphatase [Streptomyces sp. RPA4-2]
MDHTFDAPPVDREVLDFAVGLATRAGQMSAQGFFGEWGSHRKEDGSEVTEIDLAVEESVRNELARHMPEDGIYGEEKGSTAGVSGRRDPINGTTSFTRRWPLFSNDIAYEDEYGPAVGVINMPMSRQMVVAGRGLGCWVLIRENPDLKSGHRAHVTERTSTRGARTQALNPAGWPEELLTALHRQVFLMASMGCIVDLVTGRADAVVIAGPPMGYEDVAPLPVIVSEAGGRVTDLDGTSVLQGDMTVLATNGLLHEAMLDLVEGLPRSRDLHALDDAV